MKVDSISIVERFADWARDSGVDPFWGIAIAGDGRACIVLTPENVDDYRVMIIEGPAESDTKLYLVAGYVEDKFESDETKIGSINHNPGIILRKSVYWMLELAHEYQTLEMNSEAFKLAGVVRGMAEALGDVVSAAEAVVLRAEVTPPS
jgi:hypothetical protein